MRIAIVSILTFVLAACSDEHRHTHDEDHHHDGAHLRGTFTIDTRDFEASPYTGTSFANDPDDFQFVIVSDNAGGTRLGVMKNALNKVNLLQPEFVVSVGDLIEGFTESEAELERQWTEFDSFLDQLEMPFFYTPGNHDWSNDTMAKVWEERYGASTYHFVYKDVLFLILNTEEDSPGGGKAGLTDEQVGYAARVLEANADARWTFVLLHQPLWAMDNPKGWIALEALLTGRDYTAFAGHMHVYDYQESKDGRDRITLGSTGGYSLMRGKMHGEFDHVTWVTMTDKGPKIANLELDGIDDKYVIPPAVRTAFKSEPVFNIDPWYDEIGRGQVALPVTIKNNFDHTLDYRLEVFANPDIALRGGAPSGVLAPGAKTEVQLLLDAQDSASPTPLSVRAYADLTLEPGNTISWSKNLRLAPVARQPLRRTATPVVFDGRLDEWSSLPLRARPVGAFDDGKTIEVTPSDASFQFSTQYDDAFLYVGLEVKDDEVVTADAADNYGDSDYAVITIDARPAAQSANNPGQILELKKGKWIFMRAAPQGEEGILFYRSFVPEPFDAKVRQTKDGYTAEFRVPLGYVISKQGENWRDLRLNVGVNDADPNSKKRRPILLGWQEEWGESVLGAGMFRRAE
ncbi:MAG: metallophosphoesterase [Pseudomonadota bacterium]